MNIDYLAAAAGVMTFLALIADKIWGGGRALSRELSELDRSWAERLDEMKREMNEKREINTNNVGDALNGIRTQMYMIKEQLLEQRAEAAETYMRRDAFYKASEDIKRDVKEGFTKIEVRLDRMEKNGKH